MKKATSRIALILLCILLLSPTVNAARLLIPGGQVIGLELQDNRVTVAAFDDILGLEAQAAGLQVGDKIQKIDSHPIHTSDDIRQALQHSDGTVKIAVCRNGRTKHLTKEPFAPIVSDIQAEVDRRYARLKARAENPLL